VPNSDTQPLTLPQALNLAVDKHGAGQLGEAESLYQQILDIQPDHADALHLLGVLKDQTGNPELAEELISKALNARPDFADALSNLGNVLKKLGRLDDAVSSYRRALTLQPDFPMTLNNLGNAQADLGDLDSAVSSYRQALDRQPGFPLALNNLGGALAKLEQFDDAIASFEKVLALQPDDAEAHANLGNALQGLERFEDALASYTKAIGLGWDSAEIYARRGNMQQNLGLLDDATVSFKAALALEPENMPVMRNLGTVLRQAGRVEDAAAICHKAIALNPDSAIDHANLGLLHYQLGRQDEAAAAFEKALSLNPDYATAHINLGNVFKELGRIIEAAKSYQKALEIDPALDAAWNNLHFAVKALDFPAPGGGPNGANGFKDAARATIGFANHQFYLDGFRPHQADESFDEVLTALPDKADQTIPIDGAAQKGANAGKLPDKMVALICFGRSGTGLIHSLIDNHPEISTLPSIYLRGYFNQGVWDKISAAGWRELPDRFADTFAVLFDAASPMPIPSRLGEPHVGIGVNEGMTAVGDNRDQTLSVDRAAFRTEALRLLECRGTVDPMSFFIIVHAAFEAALNNRADKHTIFYHIHNPDDFAQPNFLRYAQGARLLITVREPLENSESSIRQHFQEGDYDQVSHRLLGMLFDIDQVMYRRRESVGIRLEDIKARPKPTMQALGQWLGIEDAPSLYEMTAQGLKWWGDPSSPDYDPKAAMAPFGDAETKRAPGAIFSARDQLVFRTLYYPFSVRFGYQRPAPDQFQQGLAEIRPLLKGMLDFEKTMADRSNSDHEQFKQSGAYRLFHAGLINRWDVLDELGDYPHMLKPLLIV